MRFLNLSSLSFLLALGITITSEVLIYPRPTKAQFPANSESSALECNGSQAFTEKTCARDGMESEEQKLFDLVNEYRAENGLPAIAWSPSLSLVANRHVIDLEKNLKRLTHDWSDCDQGWSCMWEAPQRLGTAYEGMGYENAFWSGGRVTAQSALQSWKGSSAHNAVILNQGIWKNKTWQAMSVGIYGNYAVLWFGEESDPALPREESPVSATARPF